MALFAVSIENSKTLKYHSYSGNYHFFFKLFSVITTMKLKKYLKKKNQLRYQKLLV